MDTVLEQPRRNRRFSPQDIEDIAALNAKRLTDMEACELLGIRYFSFANWKSKNKNSIKLAEAITRARATKLNACIEAIDEAGEDSELLQAGKVYTKRGDWRAKAWLAERVLAPERLGDRVNDQPSVTVNVLSIDSMAKIEQSFRQQIQPQSTTKLVGNEQDTVIIEQSKQ